MPSHMKLALQNGITAEELGELVPHLAFYAGWPNATTAAEVLVSVLEATSREMVYEMATSRPMSI